MLAYTLTPTSATVMLDGRMRSIRSTAPNFKEVSGILKSIGNATPGTTLYAELTRELSTALDIRKFIVKASSGKIQVGEDTVLYEGKPIHGEVAKRLLDLVSHGISIDPLSRFLERLHKNPNLNAIEEVFLWLESGNLPLTRDGCFLAYKKVRADYTSSHPSPDGTHMRNMPGDIPTMKRNECDTDRDNTCSRGLHFCSWDYLGGFGVGGESKVVVVKVAPEDVVAIPSDYKNCKGRAWTYAVVDEVPEEDCKHFFDGKPVVSSIGHYQDDEEENENECECDDSCEDTCDPGILPDASPAELEPATVTFQDLRKKNRKTTLTIDELRAEVAKFGQRGWSRLTGVPRTTLQGWLKN